jgi:hypothetical protein
VKDELERLKSQDAELKKEIKSFFRELSDELDGIIPRSICNLAKSSPAERLNNDWQKLAKSRLPSAFSPLAEKFNPHIEGIASQLQIEKNKPIQILPNGVEPEFAEYASAFIQKTADIRTSIAYLAWSSINLEGTKASIQSLITSSSEEHTESLLNNISIGKKTAREIKPLKDILNILRWAHKKRVEISDKENALKLLEELKSPLDSLKSIKKFAENEVESTFGEIQSKTIDIWKTMYPESSSGLTPAKLTVGKGHDKSVTAFLSKSEAYEVPGQFFGNAGLQRSVALAFYFALLEKHPDGLGFAVMDDPILSLDDGHRESWTRRILKQWMHRMQFVVATHQHHYLNNCRNQFVDGIVVELNPRIRKNRISWRPGRRLDRANEELNRSHANAPTEMRKYREDILLTLDAYSATPFFDSNNLKESLGRYQNFSKPDPLASEGQIKIIKVLIDERVTTVLDPGSHALTEADVTFEMIQDCYKTLKNCERIIEREIERLESLRLHSLRVSSIPSGLIRFEKLLNETSWQDSINFNEFGRAAAKGEFREIDSSDNFGVDQIDMGDAILISSETLDPVGKMGQWALLAPEDGNFNDGDLVAACCANSSDKENDRFLRRIWSNGDSWVLQSINPIEPINDIVVPKTHSAPRKIIGILYEPFQAPYSHSRIAVSEWLTHTKFKPSELHNLKTISVEGKSLDPIARDGQKVLVKEKPSNTFRNGDLVVLKTSINGIGDVIKRIYQKDDTIILISSNPVDSHPPLLLTKEQLMSSDFWKVQGVLFESIS